MKKALLAIGMAIALATAVTACGGDGDDTSAEALTKSEFIEQADAICKAGEETLDEDADVFAEENDVDTEAPTQEQQEEVIAEVAGPGIRQQAEEIGELGAPEGDEETIEAMVEAVEEGADELESDPAGLLEGKTPLAEGSKLAQEYGLTECGEGG